MTYQTKSRRCLGIDPELSNTGWAVVSHKRCGQFAIVACGCISTHKMESESMRALQIYNAIRDALRKHDPDLIAVERVFFNQNPSSCLSTAGVSYICLLAAEQSGIKSLTFTPQQVKAACGAGAKASKAAVKQFVSKVTRTQINNSHIADAIATAIAGVLNMRKERK